MLPLSVMRRLNVACTSLPSDGNDGVQIIQAMRQSLVRVAQASSHGPGAIPKDRKKVATRPDEVPGPLLNMALLNLGGMYPDTRYAAYKVFSLRLFSCFVLCQGVNAFPSFVMSPCAGNLSAIVGHSVAL